MVDQSHRLDCQQNIASTSSWQLNQVWFYLSELSINTSQGWQALPLKGTQWQQHNIALLGQHCSQHGSRNWQIQLASPMPKHHTGELRFSLGLPWQKNHQNPLTAKGIFANSNMFWSWQQGYKFFRLDLRNEQQGISWAFHLGATGCRSPSAVRAPQQACTQPNKPLITLTNVDGDQTIALDLNRLLAKVTLAQDSRCLSLPTQSSCARLLTNLGLNSQSSAFINLMPATGGSNE